MEKYSLQISRGDSLDITDFGNDVIRFTKLTWAEVLRLCKLSFAEGYATTIWREDNGEAGEGE